MKLIYKDNIIGKVYRNLVSCTDFICNKTPEAGFDVNDYNTLLDISGMTSGDYVIAFNKPPRTSGEAAVIQTYEVDNVTSEIWLSFDIDTETLEVKRVRGDIFSNISDVFSYTENDVTYYAVSFTATIPENATLTFTYAAPKIAINIYKKK